MNNVFVLLLMIFLHILDDYGMQGILASMKQKEWWKKNAPQPLYKYDYIWALIMHSFSWSFMIMLPFAIQNGFSVNGVFVGMLGFNMICHAVIDHMKANSGIINLWVDQICHMLQIFGTFIIMTHGA